MRKKKVHQNLLVQPQKFKIFDLGLIPIETVARANMLIIPKSCWMHDLLEENLIKNTVKISCGQPITQKHKSKSEIWQILKLDLQDWLLESCTSKF